MTPLISFSFILFTLFLLTISATRAQVPVFSPAAAEEEMQCSVEGVCTATERTCSPYKLTFYSNKPVEVFIGGVEVPHTVLGRISSIEVTEHTCEDILFVMENEVWAAPVGLSAILESGSDIYATSMFVKGNSSDASGNWGLKYVHVEFEEQGDVKPLFGIGTNTEFDPEKPINFTAWRAGAVVDSVLKERYGYFAEFRDHGALPLHWSDGPMKVGLSGLKLCNPLGHASDEAQTVVSACYNLKME